MHTEVESENLLKDLGRDLGYYEEKWHVCVCEFVLKVSSCGLVVSCYEHSNERKILLCGIC